ncbi:hypothetical protein BGAL_0065g00020 [Botrytis galanthina]|uniref:Methyltransferase type 12 domain-containing protein n=1 Tax=Botrytis galanthina TaxID=278940 RepID=A0A4S8RH20_9HELO|nr:hypothetical protein BGAL_0065g00020 [Botrytis galanthina]
MRVLEDGAGTGATTRVLLGALTSLGGTFPKHTRYLQYDFTDISSGLFEKAKENFQDFPRLHFLTLDIEKDSSSQGFELGSYDLIVASLVLHVMKELVVTLKHVRSLLRPGGKLILLEFVKPELSRFSFSVGLSSESYQHSDPLVTGSKWHQILVDEGFTGKDLELKDFEDENCSKLSLILSTALADPPMDNINRINHEIVLITLGLLSAEAGIERSRDYLESQGYRTTQVNSL